MWLIRGTVFFPVHTMKACRGRRGIAPFILISALDGGGWSTSHLGHFTSGKEHPVRFVQEDGWAIEPVWTFWRRGYLINLLPLRDSNCGFVA
jgi:hypothetical protein